MKRCASVWWNLPNLKEPQKDIDSVKMKCIRYEERKDNAPVIRLHWKNVGGNQTKTRTQRSPPRVMENRLTRRTDVRTKFHGYCSELEHLNSIRSVAMEMMQEKKRMIKDEDEHPTNVGKKPIPPKVKPRNEHSRIPRKSDNYQKRDNSKICNTINKNDNNVGVTCRFEPSSNYNEDVSNKLESSNFVKMKTGQPKTQYTPRYHKIVNNKEMLPTYIKQTRITDLTVWIKWKSS